MLGPYAEWLVDTGGIQDMTRHGASWRVGLGFLVIGLGLFGIAAFMAIHVVQEMRIGRGLIIDGEEISAFVVTAERIERSDCEHNQPSICQSAYTYPATVVYEVAGLRTGAELRLTSEEYTAYETGIEVFVDVIYLPSDPTEVERSRGARLYAAERDTLLIYVLAAFGLTFTLIGSIALLVARKQAARPSTGQGR